MAEASSSSSSTSRLEPFLLIGRSTKGAAAAKVIMDATAASGVYVFAELLDLPNIQQLQSDSEYSRYYSLLQLFAYGTLHDYQSIASSLPELTPAHLTKLRHLTLVSLALQHRSLSYGQLLPALNLTSARELEDLIIDVIYADLLRGKIHHHERILHVDWVSGRDLREDDLIQLKQGLENWTSTAASLLQALDDQIDRVQNNAQKDKDASNVYNSRRNELYMAIVDSTNRGNNSGRRPANQASGLSRLAGDKGSEGGRRLGARSVQQPDELAGERSSKRQRDGSDSVVHQ